MLTLSFYEGFTYIDPLACCNEGQMLLFSLLKDLCMKARMAVSSIFLK